MTISVWHKNGIGRQQGDEPSSIVHVYKNGVLADTNDKWELITLVYAHPTNER